jgi:DNA-binding Lrp family transcriptional regulator
VYWAALIGGTYELFVVVLVKNYHELEAFLESIFKKHPDVLKDYEALLTFKHEFYNHKFLDVEPSATKLDLVKTPEKGIGSLDRKILHIISGNCRQSKLSIAKECSANYQTIKHHIRILENQGVIAGYRLFLKSEEFGQRAFFVLLNFESYGKQFEDRLLAFCKVHKQITQASKIFGRWSLMLHLRARDNRELQDVIIEIRQRFPGIGHYEIIPIFEDFSISLHPI